MSEIDHHFQTIEDKVGLPFVDLRTMAAELVGAHYDPKLLHTEQLLLGIGSLGVHSLSQEELDLIVARHTTEQQKFKGRFDIPFSEKERTVSQRILNTLVPFKHPDKYATDDLLLTELADKEQKALLPSVVGRLSTREILETGTRYVRKRRGNVHYTKWASSDHRREYHYHANRVLNRLKEPYEIGSSEN